jgi:hypothetical protein
MSLPIGEWRRLRRIERSLARSDSRLASLYSIFTRLTRTDAMPAGERLENRLLYIPRRKLAIRPERPATAWRTW